MAATTTDVYPLHQTSLLHRSAPSAQQQAHVSMLDADESMMSDNKRTRKVVNHKTIDYNSSVNCGLEVNTSLGSYGLDDVCGSRDCCVGS